MPSHHLLHQGLLLHLLLLLLHLLLLLLDHLLLLELLLLLDYLLLLALGELLIPGLRGLSLSKLHLLFGHFNTVHLHEQVKHELLVFP